MIMKIHHALILTKSRISSRIYENHTIGPLEPTNLKLTQLK